MSNLSPRESAITIIKGRGEVVVDYNYAVLVARVKTRADTAPKAKSEADEHARVLLAKIEEFQRLGLIDEVKTHFSTDPAMKYDDEERVMCGYDAEFILRCTTKDVAEVDGMHQALTRLSDAVAIMSPIFRLRNHAEVYLEAQQKAWEDILSKVAFQCDLIGVNRDSLTVCWWDAEPARVFGAAASAGDLDEDDPQTIVSGKECVRAVLHVGFARQ